MVMVYITGINLLDWSATGVERLYLIPLISYKFAFEKQE